METVECRLEAMAVDRDEILRLLDGQRREIERFGVKSLRLFGSVARGEASVDSDVDVLVDFEKPPSFSNFMRLRIFLEDLLGAKVDLVTERGLRDPVRPYVESEAIRVA
jgi:predicted nucleotidyltransferase